MNTSPGDMQQFTRKVWAATAIVAFFVIIIWLLKATFSVLLLIFAAAIIALYFHGLASMIHRLTKMPSKASLLVSFFLTFILIGLFFWLTGSRVQQQVSTIQEQFPEMMDQLKSRLRSSQAGQQILDRVTSEKNMEKAGAVLQSFFRSTFGVIGDLYVVLFLAIFFTFGPEVYKKGMVKLAPKKSREKVDSVIKEVGTTLQKWLKGQLIAMLVVAVLTATGLFIIGVPMALTLALIAGILNFIPNFGPILALIPAVLVSLSMGETTAYLVIGLYVFIQVLESNLITPQIQKKMIEIPPALIIMSQLFMGVLVGGWGIILATPLVAVLITVVQQTYIKNQDEVA